MWAQEKIFYKKISLKLGLLSSWERPFIFIFCCCFEAINVCYRPALWHHLRHKYFLRVNRVCLLPDASIQFELTANRFRVLVSLCTLILLSKRFASSALMSVPTRAKKRTKKGTRPSVNYAKDWLDQLNLFPCDL